MQLVVNVARVALIAALGAVTAWFYFYYWFVVRMRAIAPDTVAAMERMNPSDRDSVVLAGAVWAALSLATVVWGIIAVLKRKSFLDSLLVMVWMMAQIGIFQLIVLLYPVSSAIDRVVPAEFQTIPEILPGTITGLLLVGPVAAYPVALIALAVRALRTRARSGPTDA